MSTISIAVFGAAGYGGQEMLRLLAGHPRFRVAAATSDRFAGRPVVEALPQLQGFYDDLRFCPPDDPLPAGCAAAVLGVPHGISHQIFSKLRARDAGLKVVDLSSDFRLQEKERFYEVYGAEHRFPEAAREFVYGLTETNREAVKSARYVANPGCFATGALLALAPLAEAGLLRGDVTLAQTTGSSGSGATPKDATHHPERAQDMRAYKVLAHQHEPEIRQELERLGARGVDIGMVPQSGPFSRGIFTVAHVRLDEDLEVEKLYAKRYAGEFFVRLRPDTPTLRHVARTNFCDVAVHRRGRRVVVLTALDNLGKGMAGQALQNLNLLFGLDETLGLRVAGTNP
jgi:N-acetyl-gamma-glutamyl-phosphate reductase